MPFSLSDGLLLGSAACALFFAVRSYLARRSLRALQERKENIHILSRESFARRCAAALSDPEQEPCAAVYIGFDVQNLTKRHGLEEVRRQKKYAGELLRRLSEKEDALAVCGDGYILLHPCLGEDQTKAWAGEMVRALNNGQNEKEPSRQTTYAAGLYHLGAEDRSAEQVIYGAQQGWYQAMATKSDYCCCDRPMLAQALQNQEVETDFLNGMRNGEFCMFLQLMVRTEDRGITGAEALVRWRRSSTELMLPNRFLGALEAAGHISMLDFVVFRQACQRLAMWEANGIPGDISCNFTRQTVEMPNFAERIEETAAEFSFNRANMVLEITEDIAESRSADVKRNLMACKELGFRVALDDVGAGVTSFADLKQYTFDIIKIDRSILLNAAMPKGEVLLGSIIRMAHDLGMEVVCEGVETEEQFALVERLGADMIQGFLFYRPIPDNEATDILLREKTGEAET